MKTKYSVFIHYYLNHIYFQISCSLCIRTFPFPQRIMEDETPRGDPHPAADQYDSDGEQQQQQMEQHQMEEQPQGGDYMEEPQQAEYVEETQAQYEPEAQYDEQPQVRNMDKFKLKSHFL